MMPAQCNMVWYRGEAYTITLTVLDSDGDAENVTGWTFALNVRETYDSENALLTLTPTVLVAASGTATVSVTASQTLALDAGELVFDVFRTNSGSETCLTRGELRIKPTARHGSVA